MSSESSDVLNLNADKTFYNTFEGKLSLVDISDNFLLCMKVGFPWKETLAVDGEVYRVSPDEMDYDIICNKKIMELINKNINQIKQIA